MKSLVKLPLYLSIFVLVVSILISAIKIGERTAVTTKTSKATTSGSSLALQFTPPNIISVLVSGDKEIVGVDATITYDKDKISILTSSLKSGPSFITTGGYVNEQSSTFSFSALSNKEAVRSGIVASFNIRSVREKERINSELRFVENDRATTVLEAVSGKNILNTTSGVKIDLPF